MSLRLEGLYKHYGLTRAVDGVSLELNPGETLALLGPSGCGKSTLLRLIAGLEQPDDGKIFLNNRDITSRSPQKRGFGMVFQDYALFPHLNVEKNIAFGLAEQGWTKDRQRRRADDLLKQVGLAGFQKRRPYELSGGQQQRVALARALAPEPSLLLLDEPLSNLDLSLRDELKAQLKEILDKLEVSAIYVTHDQGEAFTLAERVAVMRAGKLVQTDVPEALYAKPASLWVARFLGHSNLFDSYTHPWFGTLTDAPFVLLRSDLLELCNKHKEGGLQAEVTHHAIIGAEHSLQLALPELNLSLRWQGTARELPELSRPLWLYLPPGAVVGIDESAT